MRVEIVTGIGVSAGVLVIRFILTDRLFLAAIAIAVAIFWLAGAWRHWRPASDAGFGLSTLLAGFALLAGPNGFAWALTPLLTAIVAWNASHLDAIISDSPHFPEKKRLLRRYRMRLFGTLGVGTLLLVPVLLNPINLSFAAVVLLSLLGMLGLSRAIYFLSHAGS